MTPITADTLEAAGFADWILPLVDDDSHPHLMIEPDEFNGKWIVYLCNEYEDIELPRTFETIEQLTDLVAILKGNA